MSTFLEQLERRVIVYDGAMGTSIQNYNLTVEGDFEGKENCSEILVVTRPDVIREIHASYLDAGADVIETNSFGASSLVLAEFGIPERARELNLAAARLAKSVANEYSTAQSRVLLPVRLGRRPSCLLSGTSVTTRCWPPTSSRSRR